MKYMRKNAREIAIKVSIENNLADCCSQLLRTLYSMNINIRFTIHNKVDTPGITVNMYYPKENIWRTFNYEI